MSQDLPSSADLPSSGRLADGQHLLPVRVYYEDTDFTGVVYHGAYVRFFERGRTDFLRLAGVSHADLLDRPDPLAFTVVRLAIDFKRGLGPKDALIVDISALYWHFVDVVWIAIFTLVYLIK